jgi:hypothetical protein
MGWDYNFGEAIKMLMILCAIAGVLVGAGIVGIIWTVMHIL